MQEARTVSACVVDAFAKHDADLDGLVYGSDLGFEGCRWQRRRAGHQREDEACRENESRSGDPGRLEAI